MNTTKHQFFMVNVLKDIYSDLDLANILGFKGGTALMLFHDLPRFSTDLDFDLLQPDAAKMVYDKVRKIVLKYGEVHDEAQKFYGLLTVLNYGLNERKLKVEISNRSTLAQYEPQNYLGINVKVMILRDMFSYKLCALLRRKEVVSRDIFDIWFLLSKQTPVRKQIIEENMQKPFKDYLQDCINAIEAVKQTQLLAGIGEFVSPAQKSFIKNKLKDEILILLRFYQRFPIES